MKIVSIAQYTKDTNKLVAVYSKRVLIQEQNLDASNVGKVLKGTRQYTGGFKFRQLTSGEVAKISLSIGKRDFGRITASRLQKIGIIIK